MLTVYKYVLPVADECEIEMPRFAQMLTAQVQNGEICIWALVDTQNPKEARSFCIRGTGHAIKGEDVGRYIGTVQLAGGALVWHIFEKRK